MRSSAARGSSPEFWADQRRHGIAHARLCQRRRDGGWLTAEVQTRPERRRQVSLCRGGGGGGRLGRARRRCRREALGAIRVDFGIERGLVDRPPLGVPATPSSRARTRVGAMVCGATCGQNTAQCPGGRRRACQRLPPDKQMEVLRYVRSSHSSSAPLLPPLIL